MAVSVRMDPSLEQELEHAAKRQGLTKSQFIVDAVERALGRKDPYQLLLKVEREMAPYRAAEQRASKRHAASSTTKGEEPSHSQRLREALRLKHEAELRDWEAYHGKKPLPAKRMARKSARGGTVA
jgi:predicted DNA-binding protein